MTTADASANLPRHPDAPSFLARAKSLLQRSSLAVVPLAAAAVATPAATAQVTPGVTADYSTVGSFSNSGWFTGVFMSDADAAATANGTQVQLSGARTQTDSMFWTYDSYLGYTRPGYDTTGLRFAWGGTVNGATTSEDTLTAALKFTLTFNHTPVNASDEPHVNYYLTLGYRTSAYTPEPYQSGPASSANNYSQADGSFYTAGTFAVEHNLTTFFSEHTAGEEKYWFVQLDLNWNHEFVSNSFWEHPNYSKLNGDTLTVAFDSAFSEVNFNSTAAIPEPAHFAGLFGLVAAGLLWWRRRQPAVACAATGGQLRQS